MNTKYRLLCEYLRQSRIQDCLELTFAQIEAIIGDRLAPAAYHWQEWWTDAPEWRLSVWRDAGWQVYDVSCTHRNVMFIRTSE